MLIQFYTINLKDNTELYSIFASILIVKFAQQSGFWKNYN